MDGDEIKMIPFNDWYTSPVLLGTYSEVYARNHLPHSLSNFHSAVVRPHTNERIHWIATDLHWQQWSRRILRLLLYWLLPMHAAFQNVLNITSHGHSIVFNYNFNYIFAFSCFNNFPFNVNAILLLISATYNWLYITVFAVIVNRWGFPSCFHW